MKRLYHIPFIILAILLMAGCLNDEMAETDHQRVPVMVTAQNTITTRVNGEGDQWTPDDRIGIFMIQTGHTLASGSIVDNADNIEYTCADILTGSFIPADPDNQIYYPVNQTVDFIAWYPYQSNLTGYTCPVDVTNQSNPAEIDLLYSNNCTGVQKRKEEIQLTFNHLLSKIEVTLITGVGSPDIQDATVQVTNHKRTGTLHLADGSITGQGSEGEIILKNKQANTYSALLIPQEVTGSRLMVTLADGASRFEWAFPAGSEFLSGSKHPYQITINKTGIEVSIGSITKWIDKDPPIEGSTGIYYKVGDYYPDPDVNLDDPAEKAKIMGVVFWVDPNDARHGKIVGLDQAGYQQWADHFDDHNATDRDNGRKNMKDIAEYIRINSSGWTNFPAFNWVHLKNDTGEDYTNEYATGIWYLPAIEEAATISSNYTEINSKLTNAGGQPFSIAWHWTSTNYTRTAAYIWYPPIGGVTYSSKTSTGHRARCVLAF